MFSETRMSPSRAMFLLGLLAACGWLMSGCVRGTGNVQTPPQTAPAPAQRTQAPPNPEQLQQPPPPALEQLGEHAEDLYDQLQAANWTKAAADYAWFKTGLQELEKTPGPAPQSRQDITAAVGKLGQEIKAKRQQAAMAAANRVTWLVMQTSSSYKLPVPIAVGQLDYYGRELQVWSLSKDKQRLATTVADLTKTWQSLKPQVLARGGHQQATQFDKLVAQLQQTTDPGALNKLATPILDEVDNLEKVFSG
jgi:hypothetical protein